MRPSIYLASVLAACSGSGDAKPDALTLLPDAAIDAPADAARPSADYDFSCTNTAGPTSAPAMITVGGTTQELAMNGPQPLANVIIDTFAVGSPTRISRVNSDTTGGFSTTIATGNTPFDGYVRGTIAAYRDTFVFPDAPLATAQANVSVLMISDQVFGLLTSQLARVTQDDTTNGALFVVVQDCADMPVDGATLSVTKAGTEVGSQFDLGELAPEAAGSFFVFNVPDGDVQITATFDTYAFRSHTVKSVKGTAAEADEPLTGSITTSIVRPGF